jgi:hypothetical protein
MNVDLIYIEYSDRREMSCAILHESDRSKDKLLGPVPGVNAISYLAPLLATELPESYPTISAATDYLMLVHFRNFSRHENSAGQAYPFKVG